MANLKFNFNIEVEVDIDKLKEKYPNYRFNYSSPYQFIESLINDIQQDHMEEFGYCIKMVDEPEED
jgi:hypothetical protein